MTKVTRQLPRPGRRMPFPRERVGTGRFATTIVVLVDRCRCVTEAIMNLRNAVVLLACLVCTPAAVLALGSVSTWLVDESGTETRAVMLLANAPLFDREAPAVRPRPQRTDPAAARAPPADVLSVPARPSAD